MFPATKPDDFARTARDIERLFDASKGIAREPVTDYDAEKVYFAYRPDKPEVKVGLLIGTCTR